MQMCDDELCSEFRIIIFVHSSIFKLQSKSQTKEWFEHEGKTQSVSFFFFQMFYFCVIRLFPLNRIHIFWINKEENKTLNWNSIKGKTHINYPNRQTKMKSKCVIFVIPSDSSEIIRTHAGHFTMLTTASGQWREHTQTFKLVNI